MKIQPIVAATSILLLASAFCVYRVGSQESASPGQVAFNERVRTETPEQRMRREQYQAARKRSVESNYKAKANNGSKRGGLAPNQLPEEVQAEANQVARQYKESIYPALKKYIAEHGGLLPVASFAVSELAPFMEDMEYKGTGPMAYGRGSWAIAGAGYRMDGTAIARDVYSGEPLDAPHDVWASYDKWRNYPTLGEGFSIIGWDDGRVTFDSPQDGFYGVGKDMFGRPAERGAVPGQAGIPPEAKQGLKKWMKKLDEDIQREQAEKDAAAKPDQPKAGAPKQ